MLKGEKFQNLVKSLSNIVTHPQVIGSSLPPFSVAPLSSDVYGETNKWDSFSQNIIHAKSKRSNFYGLIVKGVWDLALLADLLLASISLIYCQKSCLTQSP